MKKSTAIKLAGSGSELARILGVKRQAIQGWGDTVPPLRVYQLKERKPEWFTQESPKRKPVAVPA